MSIPIGKTGKERAEIRAAQAAKDAEKVSQLSGKPPKHRSTHYASKLVVTERAVNWVLNYALNNISTHLLGHLWPSAETDKLIRDRNRINKELKVSIEKDLKRYREHTLRETENNS